MNQNPNNQTNKPDESPAKTCPQCGQQEFTAGERDWMPDICIGRGGCFPCHCNNEECKNYRFYKFYGMRLAQHSIRQKKIINIDPASLRNRA